MEDYIKDGILTISQVAKLLKVSSKTIYKLVCNKRIPGRIYARKVGLAWRIQRKDIHTFLDEESNNK